MRTRRFRVAYGVLAAAGLAAAGASTWLVVSGRGSADAATCTERIPAGRELAKAWRTAELFVADVLLDRQRACGYGLSTRALRGSLPLRPFSTNYPPVPIARASRDPRAKQAAYMIARRDAGLVALAVGGRPRIALLVGLSAPRAGRAAYDLGLTIENGSWRVDSVKRVRITDN